MVHVIFIVKINGTLSHFILHLSFEKLPLWRFYNDWGSQIISRTMRANFGVWFYECSTSSALERGYIRYEFHIPWWNINCNIQIFLRSSHKFDYGREYFCQYIASRDVGLPTGLLYYYTNIYITYAASKL